MKDDNKLKQIKDLINQLNKWSYEYYTLGKPSISDTTYDGQYDKLVKLEEETGIILSNSPTQKVGNIILSELKKVKHEYPLLSLNKVKEKDIQKLYDFIGDKSVISMWKCDGLTCDLTYDNGILVKGETRGNGIEGEDITHNVKVFSNIPLKIPYKEHVHIIGEAIIDYDTFNKINSKLPEDKQYKNTRNLVSGSVRQLDSSICKSRNVKFIGYIVENNNKLKTKLDQIMFIKEQGFYAIQYREIWKYSHATLNDTILELKESAQKQNIPIDGLVFMYDNIAYGKSLGNTLHHPLHSIALKFNEDSELTRITNVIWSSGRTRVLTPVAEFEPVELEGSTIKKATLDNISQIEKLQIGIGDEVSVIKANSIIPKIIDNITKSKNLKIPDICPQCGSPTEIRISDKGIKSLYCTNLNCALVQQLVHYCSRNAMNIKGLSKETIKKFVDKGFIKQIEDIYVLWQYENQIINIDGFGQKSFDKLLNSIEESRNCKLENFIYSLGIPMVGIQTARDIVKFAKENMFGSNKAEIAIAEDITYNQWLQMTNCGETLAKSLTDYFNDKNLKDQYYDLLNQIILIEDNQQQSKEGIFSGKQIYCSGAFRDYKKNQLKQIVESNGGIFANGLKKSLDIIIMADKSKGNDKDLKARKMGVQVMYENEFIKLI